jgi:hypothetical protein
MFHAHAERAHPRQLAQRQVQAPRGPSSQNIRFCPFARAKACSSARFTAVCTAVPGLLSPVDQFSQWPRISAWPHL